MLPFGGMVTHLAVKISKKARPVRSVGLVVYSYLGDSLLSSAGSNQEGKQRFLCWFPCPSRPRELWAVQVAEIQWVQERPVWIHDIFLPGLVKTVRAWADPGSVALFVLPSPPPTMPSASWRVNWLTAPF